MTRGLVARRPLIRPVYEAVASKSYLIMTGTSLEPVSPSSDLSVLAASPLIDFDP